MIFIVVLALLIFGPKRLPEVGRTIGKGMAQFRKATSDLRRTIETEIALENEPQRPAGRPAAQPGAQPRHAQLQLPGASLPAVPPVSPVSPVSPESDTAPNPAPEPTPDRAPATAAAPQQVPDGAVEVLPPVETDSGASRRS